MALKYASEVSNIKGQATRLRNRLTKSIKQIGDSVDISIKSVAVDIYQRSQELVPVDTALLKTSAFIKRDESKTTGVGSNITYTIGYNITNMSGEFIIAPKNNSAYYAIYVHEGLRPHGVAKHKSPTGIKFLERAVNENRSKLKELIKRGIIKGFKLNTQVGRSFSRT